MGRKVGWKERKKRGRGTIGRRGKAKDYTRGMIGRGWEGIKLEEFIDEGGIMEKVSWKYYITGENYEEREPKKK